MNVPLHVDDTNEGPVTQLFNSVVDHRSWYVQISVLNKQLEAVCDSGASVSCLSEKLFNQISENHQVKIQPSTTRLSNANQMLIITEGPVSAPIEIGPRAYEHTFSALIEAASDCPLDLIFLTQKTVMHCFQKENLKMIEIHWSLFTENSFRWTKSNFKE